MTERAPWGFLEIPRDYLHFRPQHFVPFLGLLWHLHDNPKAYGDYEPFDDRQTSLKKLGYGVWQAGTTLGAAIYLVTR